MKQLEKFVHQNRSAFDDKEPSRKVWSSIHRNLFGTVAVWNSVVVWRVAAALLLGLCIYLAIPRVFEQRDKTLALHEFHDVERFYISQISDKIDQIKQSKGDETGLNGFTHDFQQLEAMYQVLKEEMKVRPNQKVKDALVLNLLVQIDLLNQQLHQIETVEKQAKEEVEIAI
ncbi:MAG: hypothetical protein WAZ98_09815 [Cyclobacteriaceae bacterium]